MHKNSLGKIVLKIYKYPSRLSSFFWKFWKMQFHSSLEIANQSFFIKCKVSYVAVRPSVNVIHLQQLHVNQQQDTSNKSAMLMLIYIQIKLRVKLHKKGNLYFVTFKCDDVHSLWQGLIYYFETNLVFAATKSLNV